MFSDPQFWVFVAFIIFIGAVFNPVRKMLSTGLDSKIKEIENSVNKAEKVKNDSQITLSEIKKKQNEVEDTINLINKEAEDKIAIIETEAHTKLKEQIEKRRTLASLKIEQMNRDANTEIQEFITLTAIAATIDILKKKLNDQEKQKLINQSINELSSISVN